MIWKGMVLGFSIAAPVGPIGLLCIRRTLAEGRAAGFATGLGAATADGVWGFAAAFGLTSLSAVIIGHQWWIQLIGGLFLCYLGLEAFRSKPASMASTTQSRGLLVNFGSTFLLTIANPMTILLFLAAFGGLRMASLEVAAGVFLGSALWWFLLSGVANIVREKMTTGAMRWVNRGSGLLIIGFGVAALYNCTDGTRL